MTSSEVKLAAWMPDGGFLRQLRQRRCVLFAGAGLSAAAGLPGWVELLRRVAAPAPLSPTQREDLAALLQAGKLLDAASLLRETAGDQAFHAALQAALQGGQPTALHQAIARLPWRVVITTNFDDLLEQVFPGWPSVTHRDSQEIARLLGEDQPFVLKAHGDLRRPDSIVLDRMQFARMVWGREDFQRVMSTFLLTSPMVFAGYSHADEDFDLLMNEHVARFGDGGAARYALMKVTDAAERAQIGVLRRKGIQLLAYQGHGEVPAAFDRLADMVDDAGEAQPYTGGATLPLGPDAGRALRVATSRGHGGRARVVLIPGLMGSHLSVRRSAGTGRRVWLAPMQLALGRMASLDLGVSAAHAPRVTTDDLLGTVYDVACDALATAYQVLPFAWDWRLSLHDAADALARFLSNEVGDGPACHVVAHAEGGLVAQLCASAYPELWETRRAGTGRLVCLGTPWHGHFESLRMLLGCHPMMDKLALLDLRHGLPELQRVFASFPALYQTLPSPLFDIAWQALYEPMHYGGVTIDGELLAQARADHEHRAGLALPAGLINILGQASATVSAVADLTHLGRQTVWLATRQGDGTVPHSSSFLEGVPTYHANVVHGDLLSDAKVVRAVVELLAAGRTAELESGAVRRPALVR